MGQRSRPKYHQVSKQAEIVKVNEQMFPYLNQKQLLSSAHLLTTHGTGEALNMVHFVKRLPHKVFWTKPNVAAPAFRPIAPTYIHVHNKEKYHT